MVLNPRQEKKIALQETYKDLVGLPCPARRYPGCYDIIQKYAKAQLALDLANFSGVYQSFADDAVAQANGLWIEKPTWGEELDFTNLQKDDLLLFRLYTQEGRIVTPENERIPNHGAAYLGDGYMLHQPYKELSQIVDMKSSGCKIYQTSCVGVVRNNTT